MSPGGEDQPQKDPAASMLLLQTITQNALDPGYRRTAKKPRKKNRLFDLAVLLVIAALAFGTTVSVRDLRAAMVDEDDTAAEIREHVRAFEEITEDLEVENARLNARIKGLQAFSDPESGVPFPLQVGAATDQVVGPGVVVQVSDGAQADNRAGSTVSDSDLRLIMNILWQAGAEAMALNGKRIGPTTTVRTAGSAILVNVAPISSPYAIEAVGNPGNLLDALEVGESGREVAALESKIGVSSTRAERLVLPGLTPEVRVVVHPDDPNEEPT